MRKYQVTCLSCAIAPLVVGMGALAPAASARSGSEQVVRPDQSIQEAVDAAAPGATIVLTRGTYRGSVTLTKPLTLRGAGEQTVIVPGKDEEAGSACAEAGDGICVTGTDEQPVTGARIQSLTVEGFKRNGVTATRTDQLEVRRVTARDNGQWGIAQDRSTRASFRYNTASGNGDAGLYTANVFEADAESKTLDSRGTVISGNRLTGNRIGMTTRRLRNLTVEHNVVTGNCAGVFVVLPRTVGDLTVRRNAVYENNEHCPASARLPHLQGVGIVLVGTEKVLVTQNAVHDNVGDSPYSGGIVVFGSMDGVSNEQNTVRDNLVLDNGPADLVTRDEKGKDNKFVNNVCQTSEPAGAC
ncbi:right-handed parallel beta-helix repeat-containing protein [Streptomyces sp. M2CJ-2]|uniref:right-handed parallel beta-helix repeat-containing protein n=1 Tax=Streptomyces sp. M2CJ-2 TaxID=2803948 RepID=UPI001922B919|nr:right-handed parallel beta-helix repeat-containing protein [Streptomyces sp. M2CJ-2]MBL3664872.1 right-handed parallel beta-helix repeat-containing protein [Streptomyces sp. M2CJ-2]